MSSKTLRRLLVVLALLAVVALVAWRALAPKPVPVRVVEIERGEVEKTATNSRAGTVEARLRAKISPDQGGRVAELPHRRGDRVQKGDVLLRLDDSLERGQVVVARRELAAATSESDRACLAASLARRELERNRRLADEKIVAADLLDRLGSNAEEADAACQSARAGRERAAASLALAETNTVKEAMHAMRKRHRGCVLVTADGAERLTGASRELIVVE